MSDERKAELLREGDRFGDYTVVRLLGKGGMGAVYLMQGASGSEYAVKIMYPDKVSHEMRRRFAKEAEFAIKIRHKNLVSVYDVGEDPETGLCYMIMDYVSGGSLADMLKRRGRIPIDEAVSITSQIAFGLEVAHRHGIVHRDVKPDNILFDSDGTPKLTDLGVARFDEGQLSMVTTTGMVIGTPAYMAPEQMLNSHAIDARADIYSLGVVLYEMLSGKRPNEGRTAIELMAKAIKGEPLPDIKTMCPELSAAVAHVVSLLCAPKPEERPQTALDAADLLHKAASGKLMLVRKKPQSSTAEVAAFSARRKRLIKGVAIVIGVTALLFVGIAGWGKALGRREPAKLAAGVSVTNVLERVAVVTNVVERTIVVTNTVDTAVTPPQNVTNLYCVIDLSGGLNASSYPLSYLDSVPEGGWTDEYKTTKLVLRRIEPGTFIMGGNQKDESRRVTLTQPFYIGVFEVTQRQYELVTGRNPAQHKGATRPVGGVSWEDIRGLESHHDWPTVRTVGNDSFTGRLRTRTGLAFDLPTEAQWEYACRAGTTSMFYDGNGEFVPKRVAQLCRFTFNQKERGYGEEEDAVQNHIPDNRGGYDSYYTAVGMYRPNAWGLYDMYGNVWEWCVSHFNIRIFGVDPEGDISGENRLVRGGCWDCWRPWNLNSVHVGAANPSVRPDTYGFRISFVPSVGSSVVQASQRQASVHSAIPQNEVSLASLQPAHDVEKGRYCVIDLSGGPSASSYPISYLDSVPSGGWGDDYKTSRLVLRRIEPGTFIMGGNQNDEAHRVTITKPFYIGVFEITQRQWSLVNGTNPTGYNQGETRPVADVSPDMICGATESEKVDSFLGRIRARTGRDIDLPTEAQWEYACRAGTKSRFNNGGDSESDMFMVGRFVYNQKMYLQSDYDKSHARYDGKGNYDSGTATVGMYLPNKWGLYDMHGNLYEICRDMNDHNVFGADPVGDLDRDVISIRGGCWNDGYKLNDHDISQSFERLTSYSNGQLKRSNKGCWFGFRICLFIGTTNPKERVQSLSNHGAR